MTRLTATAARRRLFHLLDAVERGEEVVLERRGVQFRLVRHLETTREAVLTPPIAWVDKDLLDGKWSWRADDDRQLAVEVAARPRSCSVQMP